MSNIMKTSLHILLNQRLLKNDGTLAITIKAQGKESTFDYDFDPAPDIKQAQLAFGGVVIYTVENQK